jgi:hypothetical protein
MLEGPTQAVASCPAICRGEVVPSMSETLINKNLTAKRLEIEAYMAFDGRRVERVGKDGTVSKWRLT